MNGITIAGIIAAVIVTMAGVIYALAQKVKRLKKRNKEPEVD